MSLRAVLVAFLLLQGLALVPGAQAQLGCPNPPRNCQVGDVIYTFTGFDLDGSARRSQGVHPFFVSFDVTNANTTHNVTASLTLHNGTFTFPHGPTHRVSLGPGETKNLTVKFHANVPLRITLHANWTLADETTNAQASGQRAFWFHLLDATDDVSTAATEPPAERPPGAMDRAAFGLGGLVVGGLAVHLLHRRRGG